MKKRIISLLLALVMALSLVFVSCQDDPPPDPPPQPTPIPVETITYTPKAEQAGTPSFTTVENSLTIDQDEYSQENSYYFSNLGGYMKVFKTLNADSGNFEGALNHHYALYSEFSGQYFEFVVTQRGSYAGEFDDKTVINYYWDTDYNSSWTEEGYWAGALLTLVHSDGTYTHYLFDAFMNEIEVIEDDDDYAPYFQVDYNNRWNSSTSQSEYMGTIKFADNEYETQNLYGGNGEYYVKKISGGSDDETPDFNSSSVVYDEDRLEYTYLSGKTAARFDKDGKLLFTYTLDGLSVGTDCDSYWLANGNVFYLCTEALLKDATEYDYYELAEGGITRKYNYRAFVYDVYQEKLTELEDFKYIGDVIEAMDESLEGLGLTAGANYMIEPMLIGEGGKLQKLENTIVALDESFKAVMYYKYPGIKSEFTTLKNGAIVCDDGFTRYLVDAEGKKIADLPYSNTEIVNNKWFVDNGCVYNEKHELIYDFAAQGRVLHEVCDNAILLWGEVKIDEVDTTCLISWTGLNSEKVLFTEEDHDMGNAVFADGYVITIALQENGYKTIEVVDVEGNSVEKWENVSFWSYYPRPGHADNNLEFNLTLAEEYYEEGVLMSTNYTRVFFALYTRPNLIIE